MVLTLSTPNKPLSSNLKTVTSDSGITPQIPHRTKFDLRPISFADHDLAVLDRGPLSRILEKLREMVNIKAAPLLTDIPQRDNPDFLWQC